jgi:hypothetical protein
MSRIWIDASLDGEGLDEAQCDAFKKWLSDFGQYDYDTEAIVRPHSFQLGWMDWETKEEILDGMLDQLPPGTSVHMALDYQEFDDDGKEHLFFGPRAEELEIAWLDKELRALTAQRKRAEERIAARSKVTP